MSPRVAIVVPVHDAEPFLAETLESVVAQTRGDWVAVVVDDGSTDGSRAIARRYAARHPERFRVITLDDNAGVVRARNRAVAAAPECELVVLLDHDDLLREDYLERMTALHDAERARGRRIGLVGCDARLLGRDGLWPQTWGERLGWQDRVDLDSLIRRNTVFARALFRREAFEQVGGFAPETAGSDDIDLWLRLVQAGWEVAVTREPLAVYRVRPEAMSRDRLAMGDAKLTVYRRLLARGGLTAAQTREVHRRMRHLRVTRGAWQARRAWSDGRRAEAARLGLAVAPWALADLARHPRHWASRRRRVLGTGAGPQVPRRSAAE